jgi:hypothetical protein
MNSAPAIYEHYLYVGSRTDASGSHINPGVLVVDMEDPSSPEVVNEIGPPLTVEGERRVPRKGAALPPAPKRVSR